MGNTAERTNTSTVFVKSYIPSLDRRINPHVGFCKAGSVVLMPYQTATWISILLIWYYECRPEEEHLFLYVTNTYTLSRRKVWTYLDDTEGTDRPAKSSRLERLIAVQRLTNVLALGSSVSLILSVRVMSHGPSMKGTRG